MRALVPVANGSEDIETVTLVDVLRRAQFDVTFASIEHDLTVTLAKGCKITADVGFNEIKKEAFDLIAVPGGSAGAAALAKNKALIELLKHNRANRKWYAAICAAPAMVFAAHDLLDGKRATCFPAFKDQLPRWVDAPVVVDGHCVTGQGPGSSLAFALKLVELIQGEDKARKIAESMVAPLETAAA
ncbi:MAG TPA: DJ-1 family glyoxalase III [Verrucomicrobiae bacterium]|nr:DJ-1 family glyoxalase III [Verrucomicrobiae bacterium]